MTKPLPPELKKTAGCFRTVCPEPDELRALGQEMVDFVADKKNNVLHLTQWWNIHKNFTRSCFETMCQKPEFLEYYHKAQSIIGIQYIDKNSRVRDGISQRWQRVYFKDLKQEEDDTKRFEASLKAAEAKSYTPEEEELAKSLLRQLADLQAKASSRSAADNSKSTESKS